MSGAEEADALYEFVEDEDELEGLMKIFAELRRRGSRKNSTNKTMRYRQTIVLQSGNLPVWMTEIDKTDRIQLLSAERWQQEGIRRGQMLGTMKMNDEIKGLLQGRIKSNKSAYDRKVILLRPPGGTSDCGRNL